MTLDSRRIPDASLPTNNLTGKIICHSATDTDGIRVPTWKMTNFPLPSLARCVDAGNYIRKFYGMVCKNYAFFEHNFPLRISV